RPLFSAGVDIRAPEDGIPVLEQESMRLLIRLDEFPKPTIAVIDGICTTGAVELALCCDFRIVAETAEISDCHMKLFGLGTGGVGLSLSMIRLVGVSNTKDLILTSRSIDGHEAYRMGFANRVFPSDRLMEEARKFAAPMVEKNPRGVAVTLAYL